VTAAAAAPDETKPARRGRSRPGLAALCLLAPLLAFLLAFYAAPMAYLAEESVRSWPGEDVKKAEPTPHYYQRIFESNRTARALWRTFRIAAEATAIALFLCYPAALLILAAGARLRAALLLVVFVSLAASLIVRNYGWLVVLSDQGPLNTLLVSAGIFDKPRRMVFSEGATVVALVHYVMPFMILPIYGALLRIPGNLAEASQSLGASAASTFFRIVVPLSLPGVFGGTVLSFAICASAFVTPLMLGAPHTAMMSQVAAEQILVQQNFQWGAAMVVVLTVVTFAIVWAYGVVLRRAFRVHV
jgi:ABC-type spermidine/putrescine transport system permease subunit I